MATSKRLPIIPPLKAVPIENDPLNLSKEYIARRDNPAPKFKATKLEENKIAVRSDGDASQHLMGLFKALGTTEKDLTQYLIGQAGDVVVGESEADQKINIALSLLHDIAPKDSVEIENFLLRRITPHRREGLPVQRRRSIL